MKAMQTKQNFFPNDCLDLADDRLNLDLTWYKYFVLQSCDQNIHFLVHIHNLTLETLDSRLDLKERVPLGVANLHAMTK